MRLPFKWIHETSEETLSDRTPENIRLNETQKNVLAEIRNNPNVTKEEISRLIGKGKTAVDNAVAALKENGFIERCGSKKNGFWKVLK